MKAHLQKLIGVAVLGLALFSGSITVWAGQVSLPKVMIGAGFANGSMVGARSSADSNQYIGCSFENRYGPSVWCSAQDATGKYFLCMKNDARWATTVKAITDYSYISLSGRGDGSCDYLTIENSSSHIK